MINIYISGREVNLLKGSLEIDNAIEERTTASFLIHDENGETHFKKGEPVLIKENGDNIFQGVIEKSQEKRVSPNRDALFHDIQVINYHYATDKRRAIKVYEQADVKEIVSDLVSSYLKEEGVKVTELWEDYKDKKWEELV